MRPVNQIGCDWECPWAGREKGTGREYGQRAERDRDRDRQKNRAPLLLSQAAQEGV